MQGSIAFVAFLRNCDFNTLGTIFRKIHFSTNPDLMRISFPKMEYERRYASVVFMRFGCELLILCEKAMLRKLLFVLGNVLLIIEFPFSVINTSFLL